MIGTNGEPAGGIRRVEIRCAPPGGSLAAAQSHLAAGDQNGRSKAALFWKHQSASEIAPASRRPAEGTDKRGRGLDKMGGRVKQQGKIGIGHKVPPHCRARNARRMRSRSRPLEGRRKRPLSTSATPWGGVAQVPHGDAETSRLADGPKGGRPPSAGQHLPRGAGTP
jgi:hypothetical protein